MESIKNIWHIFTEKSSKDLPPPYSVNNESSQNGNNVQQNEVSKLKFVTSSLVRSSKT